MPLEAVLRDRAARGGVALPDDLVEPLLVYYQLLRRWNEKINLTALGDTDEAVDRLLLEPMAAAQVIQEHLSDPEHRSHLALIDLGSGGGSPAIPLALALKVDRLVMVESRGRKAAFLREVARAVTIAPNVDVESERFEELSRREPFLERFDLVSIRAVRIEAASLLAAESFLRHDGLAVLFRGHEAPELPQGAPKLGHVLVTPLLRTSTTEMSLLRRQ